MKTVSVLIPYRNRLDTFRVLADNVSVVDKANVEFHVISMGDSDPLVSVLCKRSGLHYHYLPHVEMFQIGLAHNFGATIATGQYILKQDVDCLPYDGFYDQVLTFIADELTEPRAWANVGVYYCNEWFSKTYLTGRITRDIYDLAKDAHKASCNYASGNCFLANREDYLQIGGCSERFRGWGWEDCQVAYCLEKSYNPEFRLSAYELETIIDVCRDEITRPKNRATYQRDIVFLHKWHDPRSDEARYKEFGEHNRKVLLDVVTDFVSPVISG